MNPVNGYVEVQHVGATCILMENGKLYTVPIDKCFQPKSSTSASLLPLALVVRL